MWSSRTLTWAMPTEHTRFQFLSISFSNSSWRHARQWVVAKKFWPPTFRNGGKEIGTSLTNSLSRFINNHTKCDVHLRTSWIRRPLNRSLESEQIKRYLFVKFISIKSYACLVDLVTSSRTVSYGKRSMRNLEAPDSEPRRIMWLAVVRRSYCGKEILFLFE